MQIKKNISYLILDKLFMLLTGLVVSIFTYRLLGTEKVGLLYTAQSYWALFGFLLTLGLDSLLVNYISKLKRNLSSLLIAAFLLKILGSVIAIILAITSSYFYTDNHEFILVLCIIVINGVFTPFSVVDLYLQSIHKANVAVKFRLVAKSISMLYSILLLIYTTEVLYFAFATVSYNFVLCFFYLVFIKRESKKGLLIIGKPKVKVMLFLFKRALPLVLASIAIPIFMQSDMVMINYFLGEHASGIFSASAKLVMPWGLIATAVVTGLFPYLVNVMKNETVFSESIMSIISLLFWGSVVLALLVSFNSKLIIESLYGNDFEESASILVVQIWTCTLAFIGPIGSRWLILNNLRHIEFYKTAVAALANVILNYIFIPIYGPLGAAYASLICYFIANVLFFICASKSRVYFYYQIKGILNPLKTFSIFKIVKTYGN